METKTVMTLADCQKSFTANAGEFRDEVISLVKLSAKAKAAREEMAESLKPLGVMFAVLANRHAELSATPEWMGKELPDYIRSFLGYKKDEALPPKGFDFARVVLSKALTDHDYNACSNRALGIFYRILKLAEFKADNAHVKLAVDLCMKRADKYMQGLQLVLDDMQPKETVEKPDAGATLSAMVKENGIMFVLVELAAEARTTKDRETAKKILAGIDSINAALEENTVETEVERDGKKVKEQVARFNLDELMAENNPPKAPAPAAPPVETVKVETPATVPA